MNGELATLAALARRLPPAPVGETWIGDDAAVVAPPEGPLLLAADTLVAGVHADLSLTGADDLGWKALAVNVSDVAAMGGRPLHALVTVALPDGSDRDFEALYNGLGEAAETFACPIVGGDLTAAPVLVVTVAVTGTVDAGDAVLRSGARAGDLLFVTGPLGAAALGLELLRSGGAAGTRPGLSEADARAALDRHRRPVPRVAEGAAARTAGATAMIDVSDGLGLDLHRLADASGVGVVVESVWVHAPAAGDHAEDRVHGGDDYELLFTAPDEARVSQAFAAGGLAPPRRIGRCSADVGERRLVDRPLPRGGWEHTWS